MSKDKKKKKDKDVSLDDLKKEYSDSIELLKAKHKQLDGALEEVRLYMEELRKIKEQLLSDFHKGDEE